MMIANNDDPVGKIPQENMELIFIDQFWQSYVDDSFLDLCSPSTIELHEILSKVEDSVDFLALLMNDKRAKILPGHLVTTIFVDCFRFGV